MASFVITNLRTTPTLVQDFYATIPGSSSITVANRSVHELDGMRDLKAKVAAGDVSISISYTATDLTAGFAQAPGSVEAVDAAAVAAATAAAAPITFRVPMTAGGGGAPDDVTVFAANLLPFKFRVIDAYALISTAVGASTLSVRTQAAGAGTLLASLSSATTGRQPLTGPNASALATPGATEGLFIRRSDNGVAGEVVVIARRET